MFSWNERKVNEIALFVAEQILKIRRHVGNTKHSAQTILIVFLYFLFAYCLPKRPKYRQNDSESYYALKNFK